MCLGNEFQSWSAQQQKVQATVLWYELGTFGGPAEFEWQESEGANSRRRPLRSEWATLRKV